MHKLLVFYTADAIIKILLSKMVYFLFYKMEFSLNKLINSLQLMAFKISYLILHLKSFVFCEIIALKKYRKIENM